MEGGFFKFHSSLKGIINNGMTLESLTNLAKLYLNQNEEIYKETDLTAFLLGYQWWLTQCLLHKLEFERYNFTNDADFQNGIKRLQLQSHPSLDSIEQRAKVFYWTTQVKKAAGLKYLQEFLMLGSSESVSDKKQSFGCPFAGDQRYRKLSAQEVNWPDWVSHDSGENAGKVILTVILAPFIPKACIESRMKQAADQSTVIFAQATSLENGTGIVVSNLCEKQYEIPSQSYTDAIQLFANALFTLGPEGIVESLGYLEQFEKQFEKNK